MTPWEVVLQHYRFPEVIGTNPFVPQRLQIEAINALAPLQEAGLWLDMGTGKTFVSTAMGLYHRTLDNSQVVAVMPPLLLSQWQRWLSLITPRLTVTVYRGTPKQRQKLSLDADFVLVGVQIFKRDYDRFTSHFRTRTCTVLMDEANYAANINSDIHQKLFDFCVGRRRILLTGTPANAPGDVYGLLKFTAPGTYRSKRQFENLHVEDRDFYDNPVKWCELELLRNNLMINARRVLYGDMYGDIEVPLYDAIEYELDDDHMKLYRRLADEEVLKLDDGGKVDATSANRLLHALGQIIVNYRHFANDPSKRSSAVDLIEEKLSELGDGKVVVFAHYRMSVAHLTEELSQYGAVSINSEASEKQKDQRVQAFISDPKTRVIIIQYVSGGKGLDGLQHVCHTAVCIEPCQQPRDFHQAIARLQRKGQTRRVHVIMPVARRTLQKRAFKALIKNDTLVNQVVRNAVDLKRQIFGEEDDVEDKG